jgi:hypothetical protein
MTAAARRLEKERGNWEPDPRDDSMVLTITSDKGEAHVRNYLAGKFAQVRIWFIYEVLGKPSFREYVYRCK